VLVGLFGVWTIASEALFDTGDLHGIFVMASAVIGLPLMALSVGMLWTLRAARLREPAAAPT
jgi:hypothetical protein